MATVPYITRQDVREEAGFQHVEENGSLTGILDGTNKTFMAEHKAIVDKNYDDVTNVEDVTVYVDGAIAPVNILDPENGVVELVDAPSADSDISIYYHHSPLVDRYIDDLIKQATAIIHRAFRSNGITTPFDTDNATHADYYPSIQLIVKLYAGGVALIRDYGSSSDTEETSKDGYKKLSTAKSELTSLLEALIKDPLIPNAGNDGNGGQVIVQSKGHIFGPDPILHGSDSHENFFRHPGSNGAPLYPDV